ncbi:MAG: NAD(+)/NADH kinase, partial [Anaerolineae bacterium]|nr:NAD(+)/NADH kinase [Anaerolineae bacterium]
MPDAFIPKHPVVMAYPKMPEAFTEVAAMALFLKEMGVDAPHGSIYDEDLRKRVRAGEFDLLIIAGGDGSILRAGHLCAPSHVPILGVNLGRIG